MAAAQKLYALLAFASSAAQGVRLARRADSVSASLLGDSHFVFLEVYSVGGLSWGANVATLEGEEAPAPSEAAPQFNPFEFYHSEFMICPRSQWTEEEQRELIDGKGSSSYKFLEVEWWERQEKNCVLLAYGGSSRTDSCSGIILTDQKLSERYSPIRNAKMDRVWKYFYGVTGMTSVDLRSIMCQGACGELWAGASYEALWNNCNTMISTGMECVLGLSRSLPNLGLSTGGSPKCDICPS